MERFTAERRERFLTLLETGRTVEDAADAVGVNPSTPARWVARGRAGDVAAVSFFERFEAIRVLLRHRLLPQSHGFEGLVPRRERAEALEAAGLSE